MVSGDIVPGYQLIRGVLAAFARGGSFCVVCDARRPDLIESWYSVLRAVRCCVLRCRLQLLTWQELAAVLPPKFLQKFLATKYGITTSKRLIISFPYLASWKMMPSVWRCPERKRLTPCRRLTRWAPRFHCTGR